MVKVTAASVADVEALAPSWKLSLAAENKSPATIEAYGYATTQLVAFLRASGMPTDVPAITREHLEAFLLDVMERTTPSTAETRYRGLRQFFSWCEAEGELAQNPMRNMRPPKVPEQPVPVPTIEEIRKVLDTCAGNTLEERRDAAIIRLFADSGIRLAELTGLKVSDVDLPGLAALVYGKGGRYRMARFGTKTAKRLDRYLRARRAHPDAESPMLWLGLKGPMTPSGIRQMLWRRSTEAGVPRMHPHALRHYASHTYLALGGAETNLMALNGWRSRSMISRYAASTQAERARDEHRRLSPGDAL